MMQIVLFLVKWVSGFRTLQGSGTNGILIRKPGIDILFVSKMDAVCQANIIRTGGDQSHIYPVMAHIAFIGDTIEFIKIDGIIGAGFIALFTAITDFAIKNNDTIFSFCDDIAGTGFHTLRFIAMPTSLAGEDQLHFSLVHHGSFFIDMYQLDTIGGSVFLFAGDFAGLASPAQFRVIIY